MIAICPACHDEIHDGGGISDEVLYEWKKIPRTNAPDTAGHMYVEPCTEIRVLTGSMSIATNNSEATVFTLSNSNEFSFKIGGDGDILFANCLIRDLYGEYIIKMFDGHFKVKRRECIQVQHRAGRIRVVVLDANRYLPPWTIKLMWRAIPEFVQDNLTTVLELEVVRPGTVRLQGVFVANDAVLAITKEKVFLLRPELNGPVALVGDGEATEIRLSGPITRAAAFGL